MKLLALGIITLFVIIGLYAGPSVQQRLDDANSYRRESDLLRLQQQQLDLDRYRATQASRIVSDYGFGLLLLVGGGGLLVVCLDGYRRRAVPLVRFYGQPVARSAVERGELVALMAEALRANGIAQIEAARQPGPIAHSFSYAPRYSASPSGPAILTTETTPAALPGPLDLTALLERFEPTKDRVLLGVDAGDELLTVSVQQLCHVALLGATGGGKSNLLRLLIPQLQTIGGAVCLADPHYAPVDPESGDDWRPIAARLRFAPAVKAGDIDSLLDFMTEELARRLERRNRGERVGPPLFLAFDELPTIADMLPSAIGRIGKLLREGRKCHMLTIGASQSMLIKEVGGSSALRDQYRTAVYVGGDRKSAAAILDVAERTIDDGPLGKGLVLLRSEATKPARLVRVPYASNQAVATLLNTETVDSDSAFNRPSFGFRVSPKTESVKVDESRPERGESSIGESAKTARILALFHQGKSISDIVKEIFNVTSGAKYNQARSEVEQAIRAALAAAPAT